MKKLLVIVDMQPGWGVSEDDDIVEGIRDLIHEYKGDFNYIVALEYLTIYYGVPESYPGDTLDSIRDMVEFYERGDCVKKNGDDGSPELEPYVMDDVGLIEVVGVNLDACVVGTAAGIAEKFPAVQVDILLECCDSNNHEREMSVDITEVYIDGYATNNLTLV
jgi:hypothetical protein